MNMGSVLLDSDAVVDIRGHSEFCLGDEEASPSLTGRDDILCDGPTPGMIFSSTSIGKGFSTHHWLATQKSN